MNNIISQSANLDDKFNDVEAYLESIDAVLVNGEDISPRNATEDEDDIDSWDDFKRARWMALFWGGASKIRWHKRAEVFLCSFVFVDDLPTAVRACA